MRKKILSPEERERAEKIRRARTLITFGSMMDDAIMQTMNAMIEPETGFSGLSMFECQKALDTICDHNIMEGQETQLVYICAPSNGADEEETAENAENARFYGRFAAALGRVPVAPHLLWTPECFNSSTENRNLRQLRLGLIIGCDEVWVFRSGQDTTEMIAEILFARLQGKPIRVIEIPPEKE